METKVDLNLVYSPSDDIVAREIEGEIIIIPLVAGIGDMEDELFTLNEIGKEIWDRLDGKRSLNSLIKELSNEYEAPDGKIENDVVGFVAELLKRRMLVEVSGV